MSYQNKWFKSIFNHDERIDGVWRPVREGVEVIYSAGSDYNQIMDGSPFVSNVEFRHYYFGGVNGERCWDFVATELPPLA